MFWKGSYITCQRVQTPKFVVTCKTWDSCMPLICSGAVNLILHSSGRCWKDRGLRHTFHIPCGECTITLKT
ncbi:hypothetical protein Gotur_011742 [Gossypium turneri]